MTKERKRQVVLISGPISDSEYSDIKFIESITEWDEVTEEEYKILINTSFVSGFRIVERNPVHPYPSMALLRTPRDYINKWHEDEAKRKAEAAERKAKQQARDAESEAKKLERKRKQLAKLKEELGEK